MLNATRRYATYVLGPPGEIIPMEEVFNKLDCTPNDDCVASCKALQKFLQAELFVSAVDLMESKIDAISECKGPKQKLLGGLACNSASKP